MDKLNDIKNLRGAEKKDFRKKEFIMGIIVGMVVGFILGYVYLTYF